MILVKTTSERKEMLERLKQYFNEDIAEDMMRAVDRNGMSAYGKFMVRKSGGQYLLLKMEHVELPQEVS